MPGTKRKCEFCGKVMRTDNLKRHKSICKRLQPDNMTKNYHCEKCQQAFGSSQSLWNHKEHCTGESDTFKKISAMIGNKPHENIPPMKKSVELQPELKRQLEAEGNGLGSLADQNLLQRIALPQTIDGLLNRLSDLLVELKDGGDISAIKLEMITIINKLKDKNALNQDECEEICKDIEACKSENTSEDDSDNDLSENDSTKDVSESNSDNEPDNIYQLIDQTTEKLTSGLRENLSKLMPKVDETIRDRIQAFLNGEEIGESVKMRLDNDVLSAKIAVLINEIERMKLRVKNVLQELQDIPDDEVIKKLESLRMHELINDEQFKRMSVADNDILSLTKAFVGQGLWLGRI